MGMYTGLRGSIKIKSLLVKGFGDALDNRGGDYLQPFWNQILSPLNPWLVEGRQNFIPFGMVCYMPDDWEDDFSFDKETGELSFCSSLKNYNNEIAKFIEFVLPEIATTWELEELYEGDDECVLHQHEDI